MDFSKYPIYQAGNIEYKEESGVQNKAWLDRTELGSVLFKASSFDYNPEIQMDWVEKVAYELAKLMEIPATRYELADASIDEDFNPVRGSICCSFTLENARPKSGEELLSDLYPDYAEKYPASYNVEAVLDTLEREKVAPPSGFDLPPGIDSGAKTFVGYLMLDTVISNCDRHDQNFEIQVLPDGSQELAPTFDQGQSLGATLSNHQRQTFSTDDYLEYLGGSFYDGTNSILTPKAFEIAASRYPEAAAIWQERLAQIQPAQIDEIFERIPDDRITPVAAKFAKQLIIDGRERVLALDLSPQREIDKPQIVPTLLELEAARVKLKKQGSKEIEVVQQASNRLKKIFFEANPGKKTVPLNFSHPDVQVDATLVDRQGQKNVHRSKRSSDLSL